MSGIPTDVTVSAWLTDVTFKTGTHPDGICHFVTLRQGVSQHFVLGLSADQVRDLRDACDDLLDSIDPPGTSRPDDDARPVAS